MNVDLFLQSLHARMTSNKFTLLSCTFHNVIKPYFKILLILHTISFQFEYSVLGLLKLYEKLMGLVWIRLITMCFLSFYSTTPFQLHRYFHSLNAFNSVRSLYLCAISELTVISPFTQSTCFVAHLITL